MNVTGAIIAILVYLSLSALFIGAIAENSQDVGPSIPSPVNQWMGEIETNDSATYFTAYTNESMCLLNIQVDAGDWGCNNVYGVYSKNNGTNRFFMYEVDNINLTYENSYYIYNPNHLPFKLFIHWKDQMLWAYTIEIRAESDGLHLYECGFLLPGECTGHGVLPYSNTLVDDTLLITTYIDQKYKIGTDPYTRVIVTLSAANKHILSDIKRNVLNPGGAQDWYAGSEVTGQNFGVQAILSDQIRYPNDTTWGGALTPIGRVIDAIKGGTDLAFTILALVFWNTSYFDPILNFILFKIPLFTLFILVPTWVKGGPQ